jgi:hypothetical protein
MAATKTPIAPDSAAELHDLTGDDAAATFESDPTFIDSKPTDNASSENIEMQRDTDDTEDSDEEEEELVEEDDEEDDDDLDEDDEEEDDEEEVGVIAVQVTGSTNLRGPVVNGNTTVESALEEDDDIGDEGVEEDEYVIEGGEDETGGSDSPETARVVDAALRMGALVAVISKIAANV